MFHCTKSLLYDLGLCIFVVNTNENNASVLMWMDNLALLIAKGFSKNLKKKLEIGNEVGANSWAINKELLRRDYCATKQMRTMLVC
jgi:hypothetical protein